MKINWPLLKHSAYQGWLVFDQALNWLLSPLSFNTWADETISSRCGRLGYTRQPYRTYRIVIDALFYPFQGPDHCLNAMRKEKEGRHLPPELRL